MSNIPWQTLQQFAQGTWHPESPSFTLSESVSSEMFVLFGSVDGDQWLGESLTHPFIPKTRRIKLLKNSRPNGFALGKIIFPVIERVKYYFKILIILI